MASIPVPTGKRLRLEQLNEDWIALDLPAGGWNGMDMLAFRDFLQMSMRGCYEAYAARARWALCNEMRSQLLIGNLLELLEHCVCVYWEWELLKGAVAGAHAFSDHTLGAEDRLERPMLWLFGDSYAVNQKQLEVLELSVEHQFVGQLLLKVKGADSKTRTLTGRQGLTVVDIYLPDPKKVDLQNDEHACLPVLRALPAIYEGDKLPGVPFWELTAARRFMAQPFVAVEPAPMSRQLRRQYERKHGVEPPVRTVILRRKLGEQRESGGPRDMNWSCRWLVNGHWRKRAERYGAGDPSYVAPYLKGPDDKPFKAPRPVAYQVKR